MYALTCKQPLFRALQNTENTLFRVYLHFLTRDSTKLVVILGAHRLQRTHPLSRRLDRSHRYIFSRLVACSKPFGIHTTLTLQIFFEHTEA